MPPGLESYLDQLQDYCGYLMLVTYNLERATPTHAQLQVRSLTKEPHPDPAPGPCPCPHPDHARTPAPGPDTEPWLSL